MSFGAKYAVITALCVTVCVCAFAGAYALFGGRYSARNGSEAPIETAETEQYETSAPSDEPEDEPPDKADELKETLNIPDKISENTTIVYEYYYVNLDKVEIAEQKAPFALLNLTREQLIARIEGFRVVSFSPERVVLRKNIGTFENKYIIGIWKGYVAVFYGSGDGNSNLKEVTDTPVSSLSQHERERLLKGVIIEGESNLMKVLEDYGS